MNRSLLNTFATWELGFIIVGGFALLAVASLLVVRRWVPSLQEAGENEVAGVILGVIAAIYGIVLAFVIVSLFEDSTTRTPATSPSRARRSRRPHCSSLPAASS